MNVVQINVRRKGCGKEALGRIFEKTYEAL